MAKGVTKTNNIKKTKAKPSVELDFGAIEREQREKEAKKATPPSEMFLHETDKYSTFDEKVR